MKLYLSEWKIINLSLNLNNSDVNADRDNENNPFELKLGSFFPKKNSKEFHINIRIIIKDPDFLLDVEMSFLFKTESEITLEFEKSDFVKINAPAIAFPYIRAYISNLTMQSGFGPVMLPSINFVQLAKDEQNDN